MKTYEYKEYWEKGFYERGITSKQSPEVMEYLKELVFRTVLEVGSGKGAFSKALKENFPHIHLTGLDIIDSNKWLDDFIKGDITKIEIKQYDLILCCNILLHIKPQHIHEVIKKLNENCKRLVVLDYYPQEQKKTILT